MIKILLSIFRRMPMWIHVLATRITQSKFNAGVCTLIFDEEGKVLLFKHTYRKFEWGIPGGNLEYREPPEDAIVREFYEESNIKIEVEKLLKVSSAKEFPHLSIVYLCKIVEGEFKPSHEISEMKYFDVNDLPQMLYAEKDLIRWAANKSVG
ncbi:MAG: NUDIX domain-containing protein [Anaerolineales bacterium]|nr:NUDIX domain-containing protein [Anaerolineales bacterium]